MLVSRNTDSHVVFYGFESRVETAKVRRIHVVFYGFESRVETAKVRRIQQGMSIRAKKLSVRGEISTVNRAPSSALNDITICKTNCSHEVLRHSDAMPASTYSTVQTN
jgi:hypothetical protein